MEDEVSRSSSLRSPSSGVCCTPMSDSDYYGSSLCSSVAEHAVLSPPPSSCSQPKLEGNDTSHVIDPSVLEGLLSEISITDSDSLEQLDRENAHFTISESIISVFEEIKWGLQEKLFAAEKLKSSKANPEETLCSTPSFAISSPIPTSSSSRNARDRSSTSSVIDQKQWIRIKGLSLESESGISRSLSCGLLSDHVIDDQNSDGASSDPLTPTASSFRPSTSLSSVTACPLDQLEASLALSSLKETGFSLSNTSLFSNNSESLVHDDDSCDTSAEGIAYQLLRKFSISSQDPRVKKSTVKNMDWVIGEEDSFESPAVLSSSKFLKLPPSTPVSPDQMEEQLTRDVRLRGNFEWAPPRKQIVFVVQVPPRKSTAKKALIMKQNSRCSGCGMKVETSYIPRMLFCHYTGKFFCQFGCQDPSYKSVIPALVLSKWNFDKFPVSNFGMKFIASIENDKLFDLESLGFLSSLRKKSKTLSRVLDLRSQLVSLRDYISTCKRGGNILLYYLIFDPKDFVNFEAKDMFCFSLSDLALIKSSKKVIEDMVKIVNLSVHHISNCASCRAKGFYCEICSAKSDIIFPFELGRVVTCPNCRSCFHSKCLASHPGHKCLKCERRNTRVTRLKQHRSSLDDENEVNLESTFKNQEPNSKCNQEPQIKNISVASVSGGTILEN